MPSFAKMSGWLRRSFSGMSSSSDDKKCSSRMFGRNSSDLSSASVSSTASQDSRTVNIDASTEVPVELYLDLVEAGKMARARGQHQKKRVRPGACESSSGRPARPRACLVSSEVGLV